MWNAGAAVTGDGELTAVGTGDPTDVSSFHQGKRTTWHGVAVAIVRPTTTTAGSMKLTASAKGLKSASATVTTAPPKKGQAGYTTFKDGL